MTAKQHRANDDTQQDSASARDPETARAEANASAAAEEAARLVEEAAAAEREASEASQDPAQAAGQELDELQALRDEVADLKDRLQRAVAEAENVRRRADRERQDTAKYAVAPLAGDLAGVADNLRRAQDSVPKDEVEENAALRSLLSGVEMTEKELLTALNKHGVQRIEVQQGERFDPHVHEAMFEIPTDEQAPGTVVQVVQTGYKLHDRLLRPARVGVAKSAGGNTQSVDTKV